MANSPHLGALVVGVPDGLVAPALVPVGVAIVAHEAAHVIGAVLRGWPGFTELADCAQSENRVKINFGLGLVGRLSFTVDPIE